MLFGLSAGVLWALETIALGRALGTGALASGAAAAATAPFVATFLHDLFSALWATVYNTVRGEEREVFKVLRTKSGRAVALAALLGGPVGMTGYVTAVRYLGSSVGAVASAVYPAVGAVLAYFFLKEKLRWYRWIFLLLTLAGVYGLSYSPGVSSGNFALGIVGAAACAVGWGTEAVILAKSLKDPDLKQEHALQIRQSVSALFYGAVLLPVLGGWKLVPALFSGRENHIALGLIALAALCATASYLCYYTSIARIGPSKSMALNVTYSAWAVFFGIVLFGERSLLKPLPLVCAAAVIVFGLLTARGKNGSKEKA